MCTWNVWRPRPHSRDLIEGLGTGWLYNGASGIGLFLSELARHTHNMRLVAVADAAFRHSLVSARVPHAQPFGLYCGNVGTALAMARHGMLWSREEFLEDARELLLPLKDSDLAGLETDLLSGAAGAIPALLQLAEVLDLPWLRNTARNFGEFLISTALRRPHGWSWATTNPAVHDDLVGLSHGSTGIGHGLLELASATDDGRFVFAFERAVAYDRMHFDPTEGNWADLRHGDVSRFVIDINSDEAVRRAAIAGGVPPFQRRFLTAWCHGAAGIGLARLRAFELLRQSEYAEEAKIAISTTVAALQRPGGLFGLCHGCAGNCDLLIESARVLLMSQLRDTAEECAAAARQAFVLRGRPFPTWDQPVDDPSLMVGQAGVGYFFLRLASADTPSVLLLTSGALRVPGRAGADELRNESLEHWFGETLSALECVSADPEPLRAAIMASAGHRSDCDSAVQIISQQLSAEPAGRARDQVSETFDFERARCDLLALPTEVGDDYARSFLPLLSSAVDWSTASFELARRVRLVPPASSRGTGGSDSPLCNWRLLFFQNRAIRVSVLSPFTAAVLWAISNGATFDDVMQLAMDSVDREAIDRDHVEAIVRAQIGAGLDAGIIQLLSTMVSADETLAPAGEQVQSSR